MNAARLGSCLCLAMIVPWTPMGGCGSRDVAPVVQAQPSTPDWDALTTALDPSERAIVESFSAADVRRLYVAGFTLRSQVSPDPRLIATILSAIESCPVDASDDPYYDSIRHTSHGSFAMAVMARMIATHGLDAAPHPAIMHEAGRLAWSEDEILVMQSAVVLRQIRAHLGEDALPRSARRALEHALSDELIVQLVARQETEVLR